MNMNMNMGSYSNNNNKSQFFSTREETIKWLDKYHIKNYTINDDLSVDADGDVDISGKNLKLIPVKFGKVKGNFYCVRNKLINLIGSPKYVSGDFYCFENKLISLVGAPEFVGGEFNSRDNKLISLLGLENCNIKEKMSFNIDKKTSNIKN